MRHRSDPTRARTTTAAPPVSLASKFASIPLVAASLVAAVAVPAAAGVYQWTDSEGNVHFSDSPPPGAAARPADAGDAAGGTTADNPGGRYALVGRWKGHLGNQRVSLRFDGDEYVFEKASYRRHWGEWSYDPPLLTLRVLQHADDAAREVELREYRVIDFTTTRLRLRDPEGRIHVYVRKNRRFNLGADEQRIVGDWRIRDTDYVLQLQSSGTFYYVRLDEHRNRVLEGNWRRNGDSVVLEHLKGRRDGRPMAGRSVRYEIEFRDTQNLWLQATDGSRRMELQLRPGLDD